MKHQLKFMAIHFYRPGFPVSRVDDRWESALSSQAPRRAGTGFPACLRDQFDFLTHFFS